jgi:hypothetical protein
VPVNAPVQLVARTLKLLTAVLFGVAPLGISVVNGHITPLAHHRDSRDRAGAVTLSKIKAYVKVSSGLKECDDDTEECLGRDQVASTVIYLSRAARKEGFVGKPKQIG